MKTLLLVVLCAILSLVASAVHSDARVSHSSRNPLMTGSLSSTFLSSLASGLSSSTTSIASIYINLSGTPITGALDFPDLSLADGLSLALIAPNANFTLFSIADAVSPLVALDLSNNSLLTSVLELCNLEATSAYYCQSQYPSRCTFSAPPPSLAPTVVPSAPAGCSLSTRPSPDFKCIGSTWTFVGTVNVTVLVIPSGATQTIIDGNLTSTSVVINGLGSVLIITGCASNLTTITVELAPADLETVGPGGKLQRLLELRSNGICNSTLTSVGIDTQVHGNTCRKVSVTKQSDSSSGTQLSGLFRVDKSSCQRWWIILVSVICGVVVIGVVVIIIVWKVVTARRSGTHKKKLNQLNG